MASRRRHAASRPSRPVRRATVGPRRPGSARPGTPPRLRSGQPVPVREHRRRATVSSDDERLDHFDRADLRTPAQRVVYVALAGAPGLTETAAPIEALPPRRPPGRHRAASVRGRQHRRASWPNFWPANGCSGRAAPWPTSTLTQAPIRRPPTRGAVCRPQYVSPYRGGRMAVLFAAVRSRVAGRLTICRMNHVGAS